MSASHLTLVPDESELYVLGKGPESRAERIRRMQANARALAREHVESLIEQIAELGQMAEEIATGGEAYHVGVREMCSRLRADLEVQGKAIESLLNRV